MIRNLHWILARATEIRGPAGQGELFVGNYSLLGGVQVEVPAPLIVSPLERQICRFPQAKSVVLHHFCDRFFD